MCVLDTDHMSLLEWGGEGSARLRERLADLENDQIVTTIIRYEEQIRGWAAFIARAKSPLKEVTAYQRLRQQLANYCQIPLLDFDEPAAHLLEQFRSLKIRVGRPRRAEQHMACVHETALVRSIYARKGRYSEVIVCFSLSAVVTGAASWQRAATISASAHRWACLRAQAVSGCTLTMTTSIKLLIARKLRRWRTWLSCAVAFGRSLSTRFAHLGARKPRLWDSQKKPKKELQAGYPSGRVVRLPRAIGNTNWLARVARFALAGWSNSNRHGAAVAPAVGTAARSTPQRVNH